MIHKVIDIQVKGSLPNTKLYTYFLDNSQEIDPDRVRPVIVICPGGGYSMTSDREAEAIAVQIMAMGYHAAILRYSCEPAVYPTALLELATVVNLLRSNADKWNIDKDKIIVQGSSAGGHLAASYGVFWKENFISDGVQTTCEQLRPNGLILNYPVITSGQYAHRDSFLKLLGDRYEELLDKMSLEKQVTKDTPKTFIWHTFPDDCVPAENSLLFVMALKEKNIPTEFHMYPYGGHGLGLATKETACLNGYGIQEECQSWISLAETWLRNL
ncbi:MAG: alpha/beta hydrolase [Lachnotalea sp.]